MNGWMDGWMGGWMGGWVDGWMDRQMNEWALYLFLHPHCGPHSYQVSSFSLVHITPLCAGLGVYSERHCVHS